MSVPKSERNESKVAFYTKALEIRIGLIKLFCRNLGLKNGIKDVNVYAQKMNEKDKNDFEELCIKYDIVFKSEYPEWLISYFREIVLKATAQFQKNILNGYMMSVNSLIDAYQKHVYIKQSINDAEFIYNEIQVITSMFPGSLSAITNILNLINEEITLLKQWDRNNNKLINKYLVDANLADKNAIEFQELFEPIIDIGNNW